MQKLFIVLSLLTYLGFAVFSFYKAWVAASAPGAYWVLWLAAYFVFIRRFDGEFDELFGKEE